MPNAPTGPTAGIRTSTYEDDATGWLDPGLLQTVFDHAAVGIAIAEYPDRILHANEAVLAMLGYSLEQLQSRTFQSLTHPDDWPRNQDLLHELIAGHRTSFQLDKRWLCRDGSELWVRLTVSAIDRPASAS